jgi:hypothetical protein
MRRYFFHLRRGQTLIQDEEGGDFGTFDQAMVEAVIAAKELVINSIRTGQRIDGDCVEIWLEGGGRVGEIRLRDVIPI